MLWPSHACGSAVSNVPEALVEFERKFGTRNPKRTLHPKCSPHKNSDFSAFHWSHGRLSSNFSMKNMKNNLACSAFDESSNSGT